MDTPEMIKIIRIQLGMSQHGFAKAIHVAFSTVNRWENGGRDATVKKVSLGSFKAMNQKEFLGYVFIR